MRSTPNARFLKLSLTISAAIALACGIASAQTAPQKFAVIDMQKALTGTKDGLKAIDDLRAKFGPKEQEFQKRQNELQAKQDEYRRKENTLSEEAKANLAREIDAMTKNLQRDTDDVRQDVEQEQQRVLNELGQKMMQVLTKYSAEKSLTMVFDVSGQPNPVLFASSTIDITADIIKLYDAAPPTVTTSSAPAPTSKPPAAASPRPVAPAASTPRPAPGTPASR